MYAERYLSIYNVVVNDWAHWLKEENILRPSQCVNLNPTYAITLITYNEEY